MTAGAETALLALVSTIEATGGLTHDERGDLVPSCDHEWYDLARAYELACAALNRSPVVRATA
jgi:hypothetical protein